MISVSSPYDPVQLPHVSPPTSPPLTPTVTLADRPSSSNSQPSPAPSEDSLLLELSFQYERNERGEWVRLSNSSSPPTSSSERPSLSPLSGEPIRLNSSPIPSTSGRRSSLSRSESAPHIDPVAPARSFQRVASGPLNVNSGPSSTPAATTSRIALLSTAGGTARKIGGARRVRLEDVRESSELGRSELDDLKQRELKMQIHEKENAEALPVAPSFTHLSSQPLLQVNPVPQRTLSVQGRQVLPVPTRRLVKKIEPISESEDGTHFCQTGAQQWD